MTTEGGGSSSGTTSSSGGTTEGGTESGTEGGSSSSGGDAGDAGDAGGPLAAVKRVLLISIDGMHQVDFTNYVAAHATSTLATLAKTGVAYSAAHATTPSDSFPGMLALATGATPKSTGVYYDDSYDRTLYAPGPNGCTDGDGGAGTPGTEVVFDESVEYDDSLLFSGGINAANLPWQKDSSGNCTHVFPHDFIKVNTIFEVIKYSGGYTAWSDKHPAYDILNGPSGHGIDDLYTPEINSDAHKAPAGTVNGVNLAGAVGMCDGTNSLPVPKVGDYTTCIPTVEAYDDVKVQAVINWIDGKSSDGTGTAVVPTIFGMNFQEVSVGEKLPVGGYQPADAGTAVPSTVLAGVLGHVDAALSKMVTELTNKGLLNSTLIIISAKHGQSPIDKSTLQMETGGSGTTFTTDPIVPINTVDPNVDGVWSSFTNPNSGNQYAVHGHFQTDDVGILWLQDNQATNTPLVTTALNNVAATIHANTLPSGTIFTTSITSGSALTAIFGDPTSTTDPVAAARAPSLFIQPNHGVIYSGSSKKIAEHGGGTTDDTNVMLLVSFPGLKTAQTVTTSVATTQVAPTILQALGISPTQLQGVVKESTQVLPSLF
jgi:hypothetical protein